MYKPRKRGGRDAGSVEPDQLQWDRQADYGQQHEGTVPVVGNRFVIPDRHAVQTPPTSLSWAHVGERWFPIYHLSDEEQDRFDGCLHCREQVFRRPRKVRLRGGGELWVVP